MSRDLYQPIDYHRLAHRCGGSIVDAMRAVVETAEGFYLVDTASPWFPHCQNGPGTELKKLLARVGITADAIDCSCNARADEMDRQEQQSPGWCEANLDIIVGWLREQAEARGLPFLDIAGRLLVRRAIRNARKSSSF
jgi:hypothetical protein